MSMDPPVGEPGETGEQLPPPDSRPDATPETAGKETRWTTLVIAGASAVLGSILVLELLVIQEIVPPLVIIGVLLLVGIFLLQRGLPAGVITLGGVALLYLGLWARFIGESFALPASTLDFVINLTTIAGSLATIVGTVVLLRARSNEVRSPAAYKFAIVLLLAVLAGTAFSVVARLTREDPLGRPFDITITAKDTDFSPEEVTPADAFFGAPDKGVSFFIENEDLTAHTFTIDALDVNEGIPGGGSARVELPDIEPGTYEYYCTVTGHEDMTGTLTVGSDA